MTLIPVFAIAVETARIQKETAALDAKTDEHLEACAELRRVQVSSALGRGVDSAGGVYSVGTAPCRR